MGIKQYQSIGHWATEKNENTSFHFCFMYQLKDILLWKMTRFSLDSLLMHVKSFSTVLNTFAIDLTQWHHSSNVSPVLLSFVHYNSSIVYAISVIPVESFSNVWHEKAFFLSTIGQKLEVYSKYGTIPTVVPTSQFSFSINLATDSDVSRMLLR